MCFILLKGKLCRIEVGIFDVLFFSFSMRWREKHFIGVISDPGDSLLENLIYLEKTWTRRKIDRKTASDICQRVDIKGKGVVNERESTKYKTRAVMNKLQLGLFFTG